ncbi:MAG: coproporphyrinogen III oxidase, partial [Hyphomicrobium sp.]
AALVEAHGHGIIEETELTPEQQADEMLLMGLRLREGIDLDRLAALGGVRPSAAALDHLESLGLLERAVRRATSSGSVGNWRANELDPILMCAGPGLAPDGIGHNAPPQLIRATPAGRFVLNGVVSELSKSFEPDR